MEKKKTPGIKIIVTIFLALGIINILKIVFRIKTIQEYGIANILVTLIIIAGFITGGLALHKLKEWGRKLSLAFGTLYLLLINYLSFIETYDNFEEKDALFSIIIGESFCTLISAVIPLALFWWYLNRQNIKKLFR